MSDVADLQREGVFLHVEAQQVEAHAIFVPEVEDVAYQQADDEGLVGLELEGEGRLFNDGEQAAQLSFQTVEVGSRDGCLIVVWHGLERVDDFLIHAPVCTFDDSRLHPSAQLHIGCIPRNVCLLLQVTYAKLAGQGVVGMAVEGVSLSRLHVAVGVVPRLL